MTAPTIDQLEQLARQAINAGDAALILDLGARIDALQTPRPTVEMVSAALWYASVGLRVFPLRPAVEGRQTGKAPYTVHGFLEATTDPDAIREWWQRWPRANVGIATGHVVDVIDIDGPVGVQTWAQMVNLPPILGRVNTPRGRGGTHLYVPAAPGRRSKQTPGSLPGIDYRGEGGYVAAPPSYVIEKPAKGWRGPYTWRDGLSLPAPASAVAAA